MPMKRYKSAARCLCPTRREPRANMRDLNLLNQAWPNAVFGLRPRLFFLLIPYIHIFVLHNRRLYERKRPYHLRASDLRGNGTDPGDDWSIRTLCGVCLCSFVESKAFKIAIVPSADRSMDTCTVCQTRRGHDYVVMNR